MTIDEIRKIVDYYDARWKWALPQELYNYKILLAEIDRLRRMLVETDMEKNVDDMQ